MLPNAGSCNFNRREDAVRAARLGNPWPVDGQCADAMPAGNALEEAIGVSGFWTGAAGNGTTRTEGCAPNFADDLESAMSMELEVLGRGGVSLAVAERLDDGSPGPSGGRQRRQN